MSYRTLTVLSLGFLSLFLHGIPPVQGAAVPQSIDLATINMTVSDNPTYCVNNESWMGDGIAKSDCKIAISEFLRTNVRPRGTQEFEFLTRGVPKRFHLPYVTIPRMYDYGEWPVVSVRI